MNPAERLEAVMHGRRPDRAPVSFWHHFNAEQFAGPAAVKAHIDHLNAYDLDFLKIMNDNGYPHGHRVEAVDDLRALSALRGDEMRFAEQLELIAALRRETGGRVPLITTLFNAWATLRHMIREPSPVKRPPNLDASQDQPSNRIKELIAEDFEAVRGALRTIGSSLANFAGRCLDAGADGVFLSVRDDWVCDGDDRSLYEQLLRPSDLNILAGASAGRFNMLHVCGRPVDLRAFADYPVGAINWADRAGGPAISEIAGWDGPAICGGVDNLSTLPEGTPDDCRREARDALRQAGDRPMIIAPGCTYDPARVPSANLYAICREVRGE
jgi:uroporphyrinogen decarboxylase